MPAEVIQVLAEELSASRRPHATTTPPSPTETDNEKKQEDTCSPLTPPTILPNKTNNTRRHRLPNEITNILRQHRLTPSSLIPRQEALDHRLKLIAERSRFHDVTDENWHSEGYNFCEH